ncbi:MAG TPA: reverse transcriptase family protein [Steroidobacter sp.]|uniref:reverse transcriptase family protein n=1 Tax=Steroidobacter sp. TaxID=1978227 RepID=UPI002EDA9FA5
MRLLLIMFVGYALWYLINRYWPKRATRDLSRLQSDDDEAAEEEVLETVDVDGGPLKEKHRRLALRDARLLPKPKPRAHTWPPKPKPKVMAMDEATRLFAGTLRTKNRKLRDLRSDEDQLERYGLPLWKSEEDVARALGIGVSRMRHYSIHREKERVAHYVSFAIPKRSGGERIIMAPKRELKKLQRQLDQLLVAKLPVSEYAHGFRKARSIATHAAAHVGRKVVVRLDLKDFFPSLHVGRVRGLLIALGYSYPVAATLATLMTEAVRQPVRVGEELFHAPVGGRHAVQGAPTSPGLANALAITLDRRLAGVARQFGFTYTRYADDLTFSGDDSDKARQLIRSCQRIVHAEGFALNDAKTRVMTQRGAQLVTGVVVNREMGLSRRRRRLLRAELHRAQRQGGDASWWRKLRGKLAFVSMLNSRQAQALAKNVRFPT